MKIERIYFCSILFVAACVFLLIGSFSFLGNINGLPAYLKRLNYLNIIGYILFSLLCFFLWPINKRFFDAFIASITLTICSLVSLILSFVPDNSLCYALYEAFDFACLPLIMIFFVFVLLGYKNYFVNFEIDIKKKIMIFFYVLIGIFVLSFICSFVLSIDVFLKNFFVAMFFHMFTYLLDLATAVLFLIAGIKMWQIIHKTKKEVVHEE